MNYEIKKRCVVNIIRFYQNVAKKYKHTYSLELMRNNITEAYDAMYTIEKFLPRRKPTIDRWQGYHMAHAGHWYYAYTIKGDMITIEDACHEQNMHN